VSIGRHKVDFRLSNIQRKDAKPLDGIEKDQDTPVMSRLY